MAQPPTRYLDYPTSIVCAVSSGVDSFATAITARQMWPDALIYLKHEHLPEMQWSFVDRELMHLARTIGNAQVVTTQVVYELTGESNVRSGLPKVRRRRLHTVRNGETYYGEAKDDDPNAILTLYDFFNKARGGQPPTASMRACTAYFKRSGADAWLNANAELLGPRTLFLSGERAAESDNRADLPDWEWRFLSKNSRGEWVPRQRPADVVWYRPVHKLKLHEVSRIVYDAGGRDLFSQAYWIQGETLEAMLDPQRDESGRARESCKICVFTHDKHIKAMASHPEGRQAIVRAIAQEQRPAIDGKTKSWRQSKYIDTGVLG